MFQLRRLQSNPKRLFNWSKKDFYAYKRKHERSSSAITGNRSEKKIQEKQTQPREISKENVNKGNSFNENKHMVSAIPETPVFPTSLLVRVNHEG